MATTRERLDELKAKKGISSDSDLLRQIFPYLQREGGSKYKDAEEFVKKTKGSFSQMADDSNGRAFDKDFYLPLEIVLETSMAYLLKGRGGSVPPNALQRGLRYAALSDNKGNYEKLIEEEVYLNNEEYGATLLDLIIEYKSKNGLEFFASRDELPISELGNWDYMHQVGRLSLANRTGEELVRALLELCSIETVRKYFNGFYLPENGIDPRRNVEAMRGIEESAKGLLNRPDLRHELSSFKKMPLAQANPGVRSRDGDLLGETCFVNAFFNAMLNLALSKDGFDDAVRVELLNEAYRINEEVIPVIQDLSFDNCKVEANGFVCADLIVYGSIAKLDMEQTAIPSLSKEVQAKVERLNSQVAAFNDKIAASNKLTILGRDMKLEKQDNPVLYDFYRLMNAQECELVARYEEEKSITRDCFLLPEGKKTLVSANDKGNLYANALKALATIDSISEAALGGGKIYYFPELSNRSFFAVGQRVTGIAPIEVAIGERYDNLGEFLAQTCLSLPHFFAGADQVSAFVMSLKEYGIKKKEVDAVLKAFESYFTRTISRYDKKTERGKLLIANAHARIVWCDLFADDIKKQF